MENRFNPEIFREYDIRGVAGKDLSEDLAMRLGWAFGKKVKERFSNGHRPRVAVGRDCRHSGEVLSRSLMKGITEAGLDVVELGVCPTPVTYYSVFHLVLDGAIMVTGSHNPSEYNGFKICLGKDTLYGEQIQELRREIENSTPPEGDIGEISDYPILASYIDHLLRNTKPLESKKIVLDAGNGTAATVAPILFENLGARVIPLYCELDGNFPNHHPDPTDIKNLKDMIKIVKEEKADLGVAFDGDADRIGLVNEKGEIIFGDQIMILLSRAVLKDNPGATIISEVKSSNRLYQDIAKNGGRPIMWKTGHSLIKAKMKEENAILAGEMSGHIFFADRYFGFDDAIYAALRIYEILSETGKSLSELLKDIPPAVATPEIRVECEESKKFDLVEKTKKRLNKLKGKVIEIDGLRLEFPDGWGLLRASNTQPVIVLRFEAHSQKRLSQIQAQFTSALEDAAKEIGHVPIKF